MGKDKVQLLRLVFIDRKIREGMQQGELANCSSIALDYEVSPKTIMRDIEYLKHQMDAPIEYDRSRHGYFYSEENYHLPAMSLNESDLFAICIAQKALAQHANTPMYEKLSTVFKKIEDSLPEKVTIKPSWVHDKISVIGDNHTHINQQIWGTIADGLHFNRRLKICYHKPGDDSAKWREVDPYHMVNFQGEWYLVGYCRRRQKVLTFAVSRIRETVLLTFMFERDPAFDIDSFWGKRFGIFGGSREYDVQIEFVREHAPYVEEREWHPTQKIKKRRDGSLVLSLKVNHLFELKRWVLSWGRGVKVLAPKELADAVKLELQEALHEYA